MPLNCYFYIKQPLFKGKLYLLPVTLGTQHYNHVLPLDVLNTIKSLRHFIVEDIRSARRFLRLIDPTFPIDDSTFLVINEHSSENDFAAGIEILERGNDTGIMSEAGVPCVADPGSPLISLAHRHAIRVVPLTGPSSILLALMASGFNGQQFTFHGYIPVKKGERAVAIRKLEKDASLGYTQVFIETPYRNNQLLKEILEVCNNETRLCLAVNVTADDEFIETLSIGDWKKRHYEPGKRPAIFLLGR